MKQLKYLQLLCIFTLTVFIFPSCEDYESADIEDLDLVVTNYQTTFNFSSKRTY
jgi:hypothetical protein